MKKILIIFVTLFILCCGNVEGYRNVNKLYEKFVPITSDSYIAIDKDGKIHHIIIGIMDGKILQDTILFNNKSICQEKKNDRRTSNK